MKELRHILSPEFHALSQLACVKVVPDYQAINAELYDAIQDHFQYDISFYLKTIGEYPCAILELGSGTGRITIPLAEAGHTVYALDNSDDMHRILTSKLVPELKDRIIPVRASMTDFDIDVDFDYVILPLNNIFHLTKEEERISCLTLARAHLKQDGHLLIDLIIPGAADFRNIQGQYNLSILERGERRTCLSIVFKRYDAKRQLMILNFLTIDVDQDGTTEFFLTPAAEYYPSPGEMKLLLRNCGFEIETFCCDYEGTPFEDDARKQDLIISARIAR